MVSSIFIVRKASKMSKFEAKFNTVSTFINIIEALKNVVAEAAFIFTPDGLSLQAMDSSHVALACLELKASGFAEYFCPKDWGDLRVGLKLPTLSKALSSGHYSDTVTISVNEDKELLHVVLDGKSKIIEFDVSLIDIAESDKMTPNKEFDGSVSLSTAAFSKLLSDLSTIAVKAFFFKLLIPYNDCILGERCEYHHR
jgi:proliferating cell nuclear antigen